jgi:hypothetical protein
MFADFRVHGLNETGEAHPFSFPCKLVHAAGEKHWKKVVFNPCTRKPRTWGTRPGSKACEEGRDLSHHQPQQEFRRDRSNSRAGLARDPWTHG